MGAICNNCKQDMTTSKGCSDTPLKYKDDDTLYMRLKYLDGGSGERCHDCNAESGQTHHSGCDMEICPKCGRQFISCNCEDASSVDNKSCSHTLGLAYYKDELDTTISDDNLSDVKHDYASNHDNLEWFKYCPYCGLELLPKHRGE